MVHTDTEAFGVYEWMEELHFADNPARVLAELPGCYYIYQFKSLGPS